MIAEELDLGWAKVALVHLPAEDADVFALAHAHLPEEEQAFAETLKGRRRRAFLGGRLAVREALARDGIECGAVLVGPRGAPAWPPGIVGSVSHKETVAAALVARDDGATRGVDVELDVAKNAKIAGHVLTDAEREELGGLPEEDRARALLVRFSLKESIYKAIDPHVKRYVGFKEVSVWPHDDGSARIDARLRDGAFDVEGRWRVHAGCIVTAARATLQR